MDLPRVSAKHRRLFAQVGLAVRFLHGTDLHPFTWTVCRYQVMMMTTYTYTHGSRTLLILVMILPYRCF